MAVRNLTFGLSFTKPPLSLNDRMHYMQRARIVRQIREEVVTLLRMHRIRKDAEHVVVHFHYRPRDSRIRDTDNLVATVKPIVDALTPGRPASIGRGGKIVQPIPGYGLVPDDTPEYITRPEPVIHPASPNPACWVTLTITYKETEQ